MTAVPKKPRKSVSTEGALGAANGSDVRANIVDSPAADPAWQSDFAAELNLERACIPRRFLGKNLHAESFRTHASSQRRAIIKFTAEYLQNTRTDLSSCKGLLLKGPVGCGKTHIAVALLKDILMQGHTGRYYNMVDLLKDLRNTYSDNSTMTESEFLEGVSEPDVLVLDDVGAEKTTEWVNDRVYLIVNTRYEASKVIIVTTNLESYDALAQRVGDRTASRLWEMCQEFPEFPKEDYRKEHMH